MRSLTKQNPNALAVDHPLAWVGLATARKRSHGAGNGFVQLRTSRPHQRSRRGARAAICCIGKCCRVLLEGHAIRAIARRDVSPAARGKTRFTRFTPASAAREELRVKRKRGARNRARSCRAARSVEERRAVSCIDQPSIKFTRCARGARESVNLARAE
jgi:hypothetical protein